MWGNFSKSGAQAMWGNFSKNGAQAMWDDGIPSFKTVSHGTISVYLYINIHTDCGRRPETIFSPSITALSPPKVNSASTSDQIKQFFPKSDTLKVEI